MYYEQVCGLLNGEKNKKLGAFENWDFDRFEPDVIVVNLGTNDGSGTQDVGKIKNTTELFVEKLRKCNPKSYILWAYGMLGDEIAAILEETVENYKEKTGDKHVEFFKLPDTLARDNIRGMHLIKKQQMYWWKKYVLS